MSLPQKKNSNNNLPSIINLGNADCKHTIIIVIKLNRTAVAEVDKLQQMWHLNSSPLHDLSRYHLILKDCLRNR